MEAFTYFTCVVLGIALGVGGDWLFWQIRFKQANDRVREESKSVGQAFNAQIGEKERQLTAVQAELAGLQESSRVELAAAREEVATLQNRLADDGRQLAEALALNKQLPVLEKAVADRDASIAQLQAEKTELAGVVEELQAKIVKERKSFDDGLVYVQGRHYLPASVVRNLTRHDTLAGSDAGGQDE
ncbi:MAG: hypothetical protein OEV73_11325 [Desulfobulbaceae bacterium]|nr:hypothetical protein [Desulfobulbaceae bacterium]